MSEPFSAPNDGAPQLLDALLGASGDCPDSLIASVLTRLGQHMRADRAHRIDLDADTGTMLRVREWCAEGLKPRLAPLEGRPFPGRAFPSQWPGDAASVISGVLDLPSSCADLRAHLLSADVHSVAIVCVRPSSADPVHCYGLDYCEPNTSITVRALSALAAFDPWLSTRMQIARDEARPRAEPGPMMESSREALLLVDRDGVIREGNAAVARQLGIPREELRALELSALFPPPAQLEARDIVRHVVHHGAAQAMVTLHRPRGTRYRARVAGHLLPGAEGLVLFHFSDMAESDALGDELERAREEVRQLQKMDAIGKLAGGIAHDFNNLLTVILSFAHFIDADLKPTDPAHGDVGEIVAAASRAQRLTQRLLEFARRQVTEPRHAELSEVVHGLEGVIRKAVGEQVETEFELGKEGSTGINADLGQMEQIILNLVFNARDAMPEGGKLTITTRQIEVEEDEPALSAGRYVELAVSDTGQGMDEETKRRCFEPFFTHGKATGTGLGLSTAYGILKQNGGRVEVESAPGAGTRFSVLLPHATPPVTAATARRASIPPGSEAATVLIVEDEDAVREVARRVLSSKGFRLLIASSAQQALRVLEEHAGRVDLLLTDVVMPGMSGPELAQKLTAQMAHLQVLFITGYTDDMEAVRQLRRTTGARLLHKPFSPTQLLEHVVDALQG